MLVEETIKQGFVDACTAVMNDTGDREAAIAKVAGIFAQTVVDAIKSMDITYVGGLVSPAGPVTGTFEFNIK